MNIPSKVKIGPAVYEVKIVPDKFQREEKYGEVLYAQQLIEIAGDIHEWRQFQAYIHELTHALLFEIGTLEEYQDEEFVRRISAGLTQIIADNGWTIGSDN